MKTASSQRLALFVPSMIRMKPGRSLQDVTDPGGAILDDFAVPPTVVEPLGSRGPAPSAAGIRRSTMMIERVEKRRLRERRQVRICRCRVVSSLRWRGSSAPPGGGPGRPPRDPPGPGPRRTRGRPARRRRARPRPRARCGSIEGQRRSARCPVRGGPVRPRVPPWEAAGTLSASLSYSETIAQPGSGWMRRSPATTSCGRVSASRTGRPAELEGAATLVPRHEPGCSSNKCGLSTAFPTPQRTTEPAVSRSSPRCRNLVERLRRLRARGPRSCPVTLMDPWSRSDRTEACPPPGSPADLARRFAAPSKSSATPRHGTRCRPRTP